MKTFSVYALPPAALAKFRTTHAEFKNFQVAAKLPPSRPSPEIVTRITKAAAGLPAEGRPDAALVDQITPAWPVRDAIVSISHTAVARSVKPMTP